MAPGGATLPQAQELQLPEGSAGWAGLAAHPPPQEDLGLLVQVDSYTQTYRQTDTIKVPSQQWLCIQSIELGNDVWDCCVL